MSRAQIWVSAVLYIGISIAVLVLVLSAGVPLLNKIRDENTVTQTRDVMIALDSTIRTVVGEGAGSQRIFAMELNRGQFNIDSSNDVIIWEMETEAEVVEIGATINIGNLQLTEVETQQTGTYRVTLSLSYEGLADIVSSQANLAGRNDLVIKNVNSVPGELPQISINSN